MASLSPNINGDQANNTTNPTPSNNDSQPPSRQSNTSNSLSPNHRPTNSNGSSSLAPASTLSPPSLSINTRQRAPSNADTVMSGVSNPFLTPAGTSTNSSILEDPELALRPDPGHEADFTVENNPFAFSPGQLNKLLNPKSLSAFKALGGLKGIVKGLQTDVHAGLSIDETSAPTRVSFDEAVSPFPKSGTSNQQGLTSSSSDPFGDRTRVYKRNVLPPKKPTPFWKLMWRAYNDMVMIVLTVAAAVSLALGLYETLGKEHPAGEPPVDWVEGVAICVAIIIVTLVGSLNDWQKEKAFVKLNAKKEEREIKVIRSGKSFMINIHDILVGDVLHLEPGDLVPVDGILIDGHDLKCDESSATGESDALKKMPGDAVYKALELGQSKVDLDPFIISGAKVLEGMGTFVATSVGVNSSFGKIMMSIRTDMEATPLQKKLERLAVAIAKLGTAAAALLFFVLLFRFLGGLSSNDDDATEKASTFTDILIVAITIVVVAVPEGLPLAVTLALAFATTRMLRENNLVRVLRACETMGNATTICSDKTGTLTTNKMTVVAGTFGNTAFTNGESEKPSETSMSEWAQNLTAQTKRAIIQSIAINSTAFEGEQEGQHAFIGSKTETALLNLARDHLGMGALAETRANEEVIQMFPFDSKKKCMGAVIKNKETGGYRLLVKGASEILLQYCTSRADITSLDTEGLDKQDRKNIRNTIETYASKSLRTIGLVYQDYPSWPPAHAEVEDGHADFASLLHELVFFGLVGIQDPVRPGVPEAVAKARHAGVVTRMVTGDNITTARAIATECGIYTEGGVVMEGPKFRKLSEEEMNNILPKLQVLARSSPEDKRILVTKLKELGETVAVTGDGTNDAPALKAADVGFSMGISGTEVAKEASAIVLMDDNFTSIVTALKWGRAVNDAVQKFLQFQITVNITAVLLAFITAVYHPKMEPVLKAVQLLWVNLIMDTFAALALATDPPTEKILDRPPQGKKAPLITTNMWKMIIGQAIFQLVVTLILYFAGPEILGYDRGDPQKMLELDTVIFNTFVWMQIFNEFNNRRLDNKFNIFEGIHRNYFFIVINIIMVGLQVAIVFVGSRAFGINDGGLNGYQWAISLLVAALSWPWAVVVRLCPDQYFAVVAKFFGTPVVIVYRFLGKGWQATFGRLFQKMKRNKKTDEDELGEAKNNETPELRLETPPEDEKKVSDPEAQQQPTPNIPAIIAPDDADSQAPPPPRVEVTDSEAPKS